MALQSFFFVTPRFYDPSNQRGHQFIAFFVSLLRYLSYKIQQYKKDGRRVCEPSDTTQTQATKCLLSRTEKIRRKKKTIESGASHISPFDPTRCTISHHNPPPTQAKVSLPLALGIHPTVVRGLLPSRASLPQSLLKQKLCETLAFECRRDLLLSRHQVHVPCRLRDVYNDFFDLKTLTLVCYVWMLVCWCACVADVYLF